MAKCVSVTYFLALPLATTFQGVLETGGPSFRPVQLVVVPEAAWLALGGKTSKRVAATLNGHSERLSLLPQVGGGHYLLLRKSLCQQLALKNGQLTQRCAHSRSQPRPS